MPRIALTPNVITTQGGVEPRRLNSYLLDLANQLNAVSEGQVVGTTNAQTSAPSTGTHQQGDFVKNLTPSGATPTLGWICTAAGTPGTFVAVTLGGGGGGGGGSLTVEELDGAPTGVVTKIKVPNGSLVIAGADATLTFGLGTVTNAAALTVDQLVVGGGANAAKTLAAGTDDYILVMVAGVPAWATLFSITGVTEGRLQSAQEQPQFL